MKDIFGYAGIVRHDKVSYALAGPDNKDFLQRPVLFDSVDAAKSTEHPVALIRMRIAEDEKDISALETPLVVATTAGDCWRLYGPRVKGANMNHDNHSFFSGNGLTPILNLTEARGICSEVARQTQCPTAIASWSLTYLADEHRVKVFDYIPELDAFKVTDEFEKLADELRLFEWTSVVWMSRYLTLDNDYGEHMFDNWDERDDIGAKAQELGYHSEDLMIVVPDRFKNGDDGPCHPDHLRKHFWTDLFKGLTISLDMLFAEARHEYEESRNDLDKEEYDIDGIIHAVRARYS